MFKSLLPAFLLTATLAVALQLPLPALAEAGAEVVIRVDDLEIDAGEFEAIFHSAVRHKFFHGRVSKEDMVAFKEQVARDLVTQIVVHREAERRGIQPDTAAIARDIEAYDARYAAEPDWQARRERVLPQLEQRMARQSLLEQMEAKIRRLPPPGSQQVRAFYDANPDKFTEPEQLHGAVILLRVAPSASEAEWQQTEERARQLRARLDAGEAFGALAREHSQHESAGHGGDVGYVHRGVLEESVQQSVDQLAIGAVSEPIRVLEGVILFKLEDRRAPQLRPFDEVRERAAELLYREQQDRAWNDFVGELKASADIYVNENLYVRSNHE